MVWQYSCTSETFRLQTLALAVARSEKFPMAIGVLVPQVLANRIEACSAGRQRVRAADRLQADGR